MTSKQVVASVLGAAALGWATTTPAADAADNYPARPVRFLVPYVAGAGTDITARTIAAKLIERWGQQVIVDNRPGAAGTIAVDLTAKAPQDGYTICLVSASHSVTAASNPKLPYDFLKDLQPVSQATSLFYVVYVIPSVPVKSIKELIAYAQANPNKLNFGSSGTGGLQHLAGEMLKYLGKFQMVHIPYKGGAAVINDALGGNIDLGFGTVLSLRTHFNAGRLRPLAITAAKRSPSAPELPTVAEAGVPGYEVDQWYGVVTGGKVPRAIVNKIAAGVAEAIKSPETAKRLSGEGSTPIGSTPEEFTAHIQAEVAKWRKLVQEAGLKLH